MKHLWVISEHLLPQNPTLPSSKSLASSVVNESGNSSQGHRGQLGSLQIKRKLKFDTHSRQILGILQHICKKNRCLSDGLMRKMSQCWTVSGIALPHFQRPFSWYEDFFYYYFYFEWDLFNITLPELIMLDYPSCKLFLRSNLNIWREVIGQGITLSKLYSCSVLDMFRGTL